MTYLYCKALHLIAAISWMAALLYMPRLFVYHASVPTNSNRDKMLQVMEYRLMRYIMNPAMFITLLLGMWMISETGFSNYGKWLHCKLLMVIGLFVVHGLLARYRKQFSQGTNTKTPLFFRVLNEVPTVFMIVIVIMAIVQPF